MGPDVVAMTARRRKKQSRNVGMASPVRTEIMGSFRDMKVSFVMPRKVWNGVWLFRLRYSYASMCVSFRVGWDRTRKTGWDGVGWGGIG